jgi:hypothetical protein
VADLLLELRAAEATGQVTALASRAAAHTSLDDPLHVVALLRELRAAEATGQVTALANRAAAHASLDDPAHVAYVLGALTEVRATGQVTTLAGRAAADASLEDSSGAAELLDELREVGAGAQAAALIERLPAAGPGSALLPARRPRGEVPVRPRSRSQPRREMHLDRPRLNGLDAWRREQRLIEAEACPRLPAVASHRRRRGPSLTGASDQIQ